MKKVNGNEIMARITRLLAAIVGFIMLAIGIATQIMPELMSALVLSLSTSGAGINSLRADIGALFLGMAIFVLIGVFSNQRSILLVPIIFLVFVVMGRVISMLIDPFPTATAGVLAIEIVFALILGLAVIAHRASTGDQPRPSLLAILGSRGFLISFGAFVLVLSLSFALRPVISKRLWSGGVAGRMSRSAMDDLPDGLHVGLAGTGAPMPDFQRVGGSTFVIAGQHKFIVDSGPGSTLNLERMQFPLEETTAVLLTHYHSDHIGDLAELMLKIWTYGARTKPVPVMGPEGIDTVVGGFNQAFSLDAGYRYAHHGDTVAPTSGAGGIPVLIDGFGEDESVVIFDRDGVKITAFLISHEPVEPALGYRFDYGGRSVVLSGDTLPDETLMYQSTGVDLLVHEALNPTMLDVMNRAALETDRIVAGAVAHDIQTYHATVEEAGRIARDAGAGYLVINHILPPIPLSVLHPVFLGEVSRIFGGPIVVAYDGMFFSMPSGSDRIEGKWLLK